MKRTASAYCKVKPAPDRACRLSLRSSRSCWRLVYMLRSNWLRAGSRASRSLIWTRQLLRAIGVTLLCRRRQVTPCWVIAGLSKLLLLSLRKTILICSNVKRRLTTSKMNTRRKISYSDRKATPSFKRSFWFRPRVTTVNRLQVKLSVKRPVWARPPGTVRLS